MSAADQGARRQITESEAARLKNATRALGRAVGGIEAVEELTRVDQSSFARYQSLHHAQFVPVDVIADLERVAERPIVTEALAHLNGHILIAKPPTLSDPAWNGYLGQVLKDCGELSARIGEALRDHGRITTDDVHRQGLTKLAQDGMAALASLERALEQIGPIVVAISR